MTESAAQRISVCPKCNTHIGAGLLTCPACRRLVYADHLKHLSLLADQARQHGHLAAERNAWREALTLLPRNTKQYATIAHRIQTIDQSLNQTAIARPVCEDEVLTAELDETDSAEPTAKAKAAGLGGLGAIGLLLWKFKFIVIWIATKGKLLLAGLKEGSTFLSMFASFGVYWTVWGWQFALGLVVSIYIHEMGHVAMLRHYGIPATAPMFIPGLGAVIRSKRHIHDPIADARVGLAGPFWGLGAAVAAYVVFLATGWGIWAALAYFGALINLFNLIPIWQLDGGWAFKAMSRSDRWIATAGIAAMWFATAEGMLVLILLLAIWQAAAVQAPKKSDRVGLVQYLALIAILSAMCLIKVPTGAAP